ncbi:coiled-coil domain-containing protein 175 [Amia ocellicauda]|uniref:coiled-coil domain-containing protein 175 n=1 Tax=Amia ocellicauda TaxID=2972642 RepID=UPI003463944A
MSACLVPESAAVLAALEHLGHIEKQLKSEGVAFAQEASLHLREIAGALTALEECRKSAREHLEVETIETSKLRHRVLRLPDDIYREISAAVAAARDSNAVQLLQLQTDMRNIIQDMELMEQRQEILETQNALLFPERESVKGGHRDVIDRLNQQLAKKAGRQILLNETHDHIRDLKGQIESLTHAVQDLEEDLSQERREFVERKENLEKEIAETTVNIQGQKRNKAQKRREADRLVSELMDKEDTVSDHKNSIQKLDTSISRLKTAAKLQRRQLGEEVRKAGALVSQKVDLANELTEVTERFQREARSLHEDITKIEEEMEGTRGVNIERLRAIGSLSERLRAAREREDEHRAVHLEVSRQLQESKHKLEERIDSVARCHIEIRDMEEEMKALGESKEVNSEMWRKTLDELQEQMRRARQSRASFQAERDALSGDLADMRSAHGDLMRELSAAAGLHARRCAELSAERNRLQDSEMAMDGEIRSLREALGQAQRGHELMENALAAEITQIRTTAESLAERVQQDEERLGTSLSALQRVQEEFDTNQINHQETKRRTAELNIKKKNLESAIRALREETKSVLKSKEALKAEIVYLRAAHLQQLKAHAAASSSTGRTLCETGLMLEQVAMENSRLHLCIERLKEEVVAVMADQQRRAEDIEALETERRELCELLLRSWAEDASVTAEHSEQEHCVLHGLQEIVSRLQQRGRKVGSISLRLGQELGGLACLFGTAKP